MDTQTPPQTDPRPRRWTREEYYRAAELGLFRPGERLELINGEIIEKVSPVGKPHRVATFKTTEALAEAFGAGYYVDDEIPIVVSDGAEPQPDVVVAVGSADDYDPHPRPADVRLLVEVSDSTLAYDQRDKAALYAAEGIPEYWIVNLPARRLEVHRSPVNGVYLSRTIHLESDSVSPLAAPHALLRVADLLPLPRTHTP